MTSSVPLEIHELQSWTMTSQSETLTHTCMLVLQRKNDKHRHASERKAAIQIYKEKKLKRCTTEGINFNFVFFRVD